jgi:hypothetical protein
VAGKNIKKSNKLTQKPKVVRGVIGGQPIDVTESNADWIGTTKYTTIQKMRRSSPQIEGLLNALKDPIRTAIWKIKANNTIDEIVKFVYDNFFVINNFGNNLEDVLLHLDYGYMPFEKEYVADMGKYWLKLHSRLPFSIVYWDYDYQKGIVNKCLQMTTAGTAEIPFEKLFIITNKKEGLSPEGTSILRPLYKNFILSQEVEVGSADGLLKNIMGIPVVTVPDQITPEDEEEIDTFMQKLNSSPNTYMKEKGDVKFRLQGVEGSLPDPEPFLDRMDNGMNNSQNAGMLNLSTTNRGSRAVGTTLAQPFYNRVAAIAKKIADSYNELIKEMVDLNFNTETYPTLVASGISAKDVSDKVYSLSQMKDFLGKYAPAIAEWLLDSYEIPTDVTLNQNPDNNQNPNENPQNQKPEDNMQNQTNQNGGK